MSQNIDYKAILKAHPETISKEQLYKLCHISKRMAKFYLDNGMIACTNTGHSTHKYIIRTSDAVAFLRDKEKHPDSYAGVSAAFSSENQRVSRLDDDGGDFPVDGLLKKDSFDMDKPWNDSLV